MELQSTVVAGDPAVDLAVVGGYVEELEKYIVNNDLYRTVIVRTPKGDQTLQMTGGDLLGRLHRLQGQRTTTDQPTAKSTRYTQATNRDDHL